MTNLFPKKELIEGLLTSLGVSAKMYHLNCSDKVDRNDIQLGQLSLEFLSVSHVDTIPAYGFVMKLNGEISRIYQDTCGLDYEGNAHLSLKKLCDIVPKEFRNKVYCMHLDKHITEQEIKSSGFNINEFMNKVRLN